MKKFLKENLSFVALFTMMMTACAVLMTACNAKVNPSSPGIATVTNTPSGPTNTPTITNTPNTGFSTLAPGAISFIGWARNGSTQFGFVSNSTIAAGVTIFFTNLSWDSTHNQFSDQSYVGTQSSGSLPSGPTTEIEEIIGYVVPNGGLAADTPVYIGATAGSTITNNLQGGSVFNVALFANSSPSGIALTTSASSGTTAATNITWLDSGHANGGHLFAYTIPGSAAAPSSSNNYFPSGSAFTAGLIFGPDAFTAGSPANFYDSALPVMSPTPSITPLALGTSAVDLSGLYQNIATVVPTPWATAVAGGNNISAVLSGPNCPTGAANINTNTNWTGTILGKSHLTLYPQGDANSGVTACGSNTGLGFTTPTVTPVPY